MLNILYFTNYTSMLILYYKNSLLYVICHLKKKFFQEYFSGIKLNQIPNQISIK